MPLCPSSCIVRSSVARFVASILCISILCTDDIPPMSSSEAGDDLAILRPNNNSLPGVYRASESNPVDPLKRRNLEVPRPPQMSVENRYRSVGEELTFQGSGDKGLTDGLLRSTSIWISPASHPCEYNSGRGTYSTIRGTAISAQLLVSKGLEGPYKYSTRLCNPAIGSLQKRHASQVDETSKFLRDSRVWTTAAQQELST